MSNNLRSMVEEPFLGGNLSDAVRVGYTVRRRAGPWTPAVHSLLRYLASVGFEAPRVLGMDELGREVLTYIDGEAHPGWPEPVPDWTFEENCLIDAAHLLRRYHDVVRGFVPTQNLAWRLVAPTENEIICHNDWAPWNVLFRAKRPAVMLDWDMAGPGTRMWDVANAAYCWVPLFARSQGGQFTLKERAARLRRFCDAYGLSVTERETLLDTATERVLFVGEFVAEQARAGDPGFKKLAAWDVPERMKRDAAYVDRHRVVYAKALA